MSANQCSTTEEGSTFCAVSEGKQDGNCGCSPSAKEIAIADIQDTTPVTAEKTPLTFRSILMFGVACFTSPCCTPLYVPILLAVFAGTPVAAVLTQYVGWIYGGLTLISIVSLVLGVRWMKFKQQRTEKRKSVLQPPDSGFVATQQIS